MAKKYEAWILMQVRVEFEDDEDTELNAQAYSALPLWAYSDDVEPEAVFDLKEIV